MRCETDSLLVDESRSHGLVQRHPDNSAMVPTDIPSGRDDASLVVINEMVEKSGRKRSRFSDRKTCQTEEYSRHENEVRTHYASEVPKRRSRSRGRSRNRSREKSHKENKGKDTKYDLSNNESRKRSSHSRH
jgi:hypothetical protein